MIGQGVKAVCRESTPFFAYSTQQGVYPGAISANVCVE